MKVLILSCNTGAGHNSCGRALEEEFTSHGDEVVFLDFLSLKSDKYSEKISNMYLNSIKYVPTIYSLSYKLGVGVSKLPTKSPIYLLCKNLSVYLERYLKDKKFDLIVCPHLFPALSVTELRKQNIIDCKTAFVFTDYEIYPFLSEIDLDFMIVSHESLLSKTKKLVNPQMNVQALGIPVKQSFVQLVDRKTAKEELELKGEKNICIVGGSMGFGNLVKVVKFFLNIISNKDKLIVICGNNKQLESKLKTIKDYRLELRGFTNKLHLYMRACDIFVTKPGGLSSTEAVVSQANLVLFKGIPGVESANMKLFVKKNLAVDINNIEDIKKLLYDENYRNKLHESQAKEIDINAIKKIYYLLKETNNI